MYTEYIIDWIRIYVTRYTRTTLGIIYAFINTIIYYFGKKEPIPFTDTVEYSSDEEYSVQDRIAQPPDEQYNKHIKRYNLRNRVPAQSSKETCSICYELIKKTDCNGILFDCTHRNIFHDECAWNWIMSPPSMNVWQDTETITSNCPLCRKNTTYNILPE